MKKRGVTLIATIFIVLVVALFAITTSTLISSESVIAVINYDSLKAFYIAEAGLQYAAALLKKDSDWSDNASFTIDFSGGSAHIDFITTKPQMANVKVNANYKGENRVLTASIAVEGALAEISDDKVIVVGDWKEVY